MWSLMRLNRNATIAIQILDIYRFILYVYECMFNTNCVYFYYYFVIMLSVWIVMCVNVCVHSMKYSGTLYNLIIKKYKGLITCVYIVIML